MFPIPPPDRLIDPLLGRRGRNAGPSPHSLLSDIAEGIFILGSVGILALAALMGASLAFQLPFWLALVAVPATIVVLVRLLPLVMKRIPAPTIVFGLLEMVLYTWLASEFRIRDADGSVSDPLWPFVACVAALFSWTTFMMWRRTRA